MRGSKHKEASSGLLSERFMAFKQSMAAVVFYLLPFVDRVNTRAGIYDRG
ncbi:MULTISPECIES: hypothetical protein [Pseudomonas]|jgi:hypothetical protein|nr:MULTISPECIES: hypothetical protein [Pseudomonas]